MLNHNPGRAREFRLELFGGPTLFRGGSIVRLSPQESLLVGLLGAFGPEGVVRDELLDLLWDVGTRQKLRLRLAQLLHIVRRKSGRPALIVQEGRKVSLNGDLVETDLSTFSDALRSADFALAVQLLGRGHLAGIGNTASRAFGSLRENMRAEAAGRVRIAMSQAVHHAEAAADFSALETLASLQLQIDSSNEASLRCLVRALAAQGRSGEAKAEYSRFCESQLLSDSNWTPCRETLAAFASLASVSSETPWVKRHLRHVGSLSLPMLGRENQRAALHSILNAARNDRPRLIAITADPGIGRSRILHETLRDIELAGAVVLFATCGGGGQSRSLHPISEALASPAIGDYLSSMEGAAPRIIRDTVLAISNSDSRGPNGPAKGLSSLSSICESLVQLFRSISYQGEMVLALDDAHLADPDTIHLITYMIRRGLPPQVTIILAVDDSAVQAAQVLGIGEPFTRLVDSYVLPLEPLEEGSLERLAAQMLGTGCPGDIISAIAALSGGSPKKASELCSSLLKSSRSSPGAQVEGFACMIAASAASLPRLTRDILSVLAVANASLPLHCVAELLDEEEDKIRAGVSGLTLSWVRPASSELALAHPYLSATLYALLSSRSKKTIHIALARSLESLGDFGRSNQIATHLVRGVEHERAVKWIECALLGALEGFDPTPSIGLTEEILRSRLTSDARVRLHSLLGEYCLRSGVVAKAADHFDRALSVGRSMGIGKELLQNIEVGRLETLILEKERAVVVVLPEIHRLREQLTSDEQWDLLARVFHVALRFVDSGRLPDLEVQFTQQISDIIGPNPRTLQKEHLPLALVSCSQLRKGKSQAAEALLTSALEILRQSGDVAGVARALQIGFLGQYHRGSLNTPEGIRSRRDSLEIAEALQDSTLFCRYHLNTAVWYLDTFDLEGAAKAISLSQAYASNFCPTQLSRELTFNRAELLFLEGRAHEALRLFLNGYQASPRLDPDAGSLLFAAGAACCYARMRRTADAHALLPPLSYLTSHWSVDLSLLLRAHGELALGLDARTSILKHCEEVLEQLSHTSVIWYLKALHQVCDIRHRFGLSSPNAAIKDALVLCDATDLPYIASRLRPYLRT